MVLRHKCGLESPGGLVKNILLGAQNSPKVSDSPDLKLVEEFSFLISSQVILLLVVQGPHFGNLQTEQRTKRRGMQVVGIASAKTLWPVCLAVSSHRIKGQRAGVKKRGLAGEMHWRRRPSPDLLGLAG